MTHHNDKKFSRRKALQAGMAGGLLGALSRTSLARGAFGQGGATDKLLVINLRGGYDAVNSVIPVMDPGYTMALRKATFIPTASTLPIPGNTFFRLNPGMAALQPLMNAGDVAFLNAIANPARSGSHFIDQQTWETGITQCSTPPTFDNEEGWMTRTLQQMALSGFSAASVSTDLQQLFATSNPDRIVSHIRQILSFPDDAETRYSLDTGNATIDNKLRGQSAMASPPNGFGLRALYDSGAQAGHTLDGFSRKVGLKMLESESAISGLAPYVPLGGALYPFGHGTNPNFPLPTVAGLSRNRDDVREFFHRLRDAMWLLRKIDSVRVVGIEMGGFDTHSNQGSTSGQLFDLLEAISFAVNTTVGIEAAHPMFEPASLHVVVFSEFGRTSEANDNGGTDHGGATCVWAVGPRVQPAFDQLGLRTNLVYNGNQGSGAYPGMFSANDGDFGCSPVGNANPKTFVGQATDFRAVFGEMLRKILGLSLNDMNQAIPNYTTLGLPAQELGYIL
ncbi:MAG: DUF1501 domain-containing protein [bacterium]|nr:DUF1501 domain-containing protein [bacterium]